MPAFPRFIGGKGLSSNLGWSMTAKTAIVGQMLRIIFPGILVYLVQGSPSGSSASGGTHVDEIGDAGDFVYRYADGRAAGLGVYLIASILWRMLFCLSYVRGFDVDKNGVKDDSFAPHNHVIDREGGGKAWAVRNQISLFLGRLDGLVGGRADRETVVPQSMTLAEYQTPAGRATFLFRFKNLTSEAIALPAHTEPTTTQEDDEMILIQSPGRGSALIGPGYSRWLGTQEEIDAAASISRVVVGNDRQWDLWLAAATQGNLIPSVGETSDPKALAEAIAKVIPDAIAQDVVDLIGAALTNRKA